MMNSACNDNGPDRCCQLPNGDLWLLSTPRDNSGFFPNERSSGAPVWTASRRRLRIASRFRGAFSKKSTGARSNASRVSTAGSLSRQRMQGSQVDPVA